MYAIVLHVTLPNPTEGAGKPDFKGRIQLYHGAEDPVTSREEVDALEKEMTEADVDWQIMMFGKAAHSFCDKGIFNDIQRYDEKVCLQSYRMTYEFFAETL